MVLVLDLLTLCLKLFDKYEGAFQQRFLLPLCSRYKICWHYFALGYSKEKNPNRVKGGVVGGQCIMRIRYSLFFSEHLTTFLNTFLNPWNF